MLTCRQATQLLSEKQDRPLLLREQTHLQLHLLACRSCRRYGKQIKNLSQLAQAFRQVDQE
ncbi:zf-HC2 domain-containing protein [Acinetobacter colistiniresistens]|uniref:zf-HC2 domain-containing protein n=1 Tax=Acinetobacter colistiniresistens TaxID=280145 RepID=UPI00211BC581|nr:zf-HC2 domain-containing protein [Acinetobacter colistiniresistens]UUM26632.1 zf-HC2 domain-containing protein [Acinetobacter colistiniresistens]